MSWTETYRPTLFADIQGQEHAIQQLVFFASHPTCVPNLLLYGMSGTGKTTSAMALVQECLRKRGIQETEVRKIAEHITLRLNGSECTGIDTVRELVQDFSSSHAIYSNGFPLKFVVLDECDFMSYHSQRALRRVMEIFMQTVRFILICNDESKIFNPLQSRCSIVGFKPLSCATIAKRLKQVASLENLSLPEDAFSLIARHSGGDLRSALNRLQLVGRQKDANICRLLGVCNSNQCFSWMGKLLSSSSHSLKSLILEFCVDLCENGLYFKSCIVEIFSLLIDERVTDYPIDWFNYLGQAIMSHDIGADFFVTASALVSRLWLARDKKKSCQIDGPKA